MKLTHRGHEITVTREKSLGGDVLLFWSIFRIGDGYECDSGFSYGTETAREFASLLKSRVDAELLEDDPWMENS